MPRFKCSQNSNKHRILKTKTPTFLIHHAQTMFSYLSCNTLVVVSYLGIEVPRNNNNVMQGSFTHGVHQSIVELIFVSISLFVGALHWITVSLKYLVCKPTIISLSLIGTSAFSASLDINMAHRQHGCCRFYQSTLYVR